MHLCYYRSMDNGEQNMPEFLVIIIRDGELAVTFTVTAKSEEVAQIKALAGYYEIDESEIDLNVTGDEQLHICQLKDVINLD